MDWLLVARIVATLLTLIALLGIVLGLPTTLLAWLGVLLMALVSKFQAVSGWALLGTFVGCLVVEVADNLLAGVMVQRFGASKGSGWIALLGGFGGGLLGGFLGGLGGFLGSALLALVGAFAGGYIAVYGWERKRNRPEKEAARAAWGTVIGRLLGIALKLGWIIVLMIFVW